MHYLWLDLETTGLDPVNDRILEVGVVVTDDNLDELARASYLRKPRSPYWLNELDDTVYRMHWESGLLADLCEANPGPYLWEIEQDIVLNVAPYLTDGKITLAGSGVATFDLSVIKWQMPDLASFLNYWTLDIGTVRRFMSLAGVELPKTGPVAHRALADVDHHLTEARLFRDAVGAYATSIEYCLAGLA